MEKNCKSKMRFKKKSKNWQNQKEQKKKFLNKVKDVG